MSIVERYAKGNAKGRRYHHIMPSQKKWRLYFDRYGMTMATGQTEKRKTFKVCIMRYAEDHGYRL